MTSDTYPLRQSLEWHDGDMPYSTEFGDHFYCREDGRLECGHVFIDGNDLAARWPEPAAFTISELGFGTGLNFCETWRQWRALRENGQTLHFVSFERFPMRATDIDRALQRWPDIDAERRKLHEQWPTQPTGRIDRDFGDGMRLTVVCGRAHETLATIDGPFDAWYLDGFSPARNPDLWSPELMRLVFEKTAPGGTFATYAAAGFVRRNLIAAGFSVERRQGYGNKREMLRGTKPAADAG